MTNPTYQITISNVPTRMIGMTPSLINGVTQSMPYYSASYFVASMNEVGISATGTSYSDALNNLLTLSTTTPSTGLSPLSSWK